MIGLLVTNRIREAIGDRIIAAAASAGNEVDFVLLPPDPAGRLPPEDLQRIDVAFFSGDLYPDGSRGFFAAAQGAPRLQWLHTFNAGIDAPVFGRIMANGTRITTSSGSTAAAICCAPASSTTNCPAASFRPHIKQWVAVGSTTLSQ